MQKAPIRLSNTLRRTFSVNGARKHCAHCAPRDVLTVHGMTSLSFVWCNDSSGDRRMSVLTSHWQLRRLSLPAAARKISWQSIYHFHGGYLVSHNTSEGNHRINVEPVISPRRIQWTKQLRWYDLLFSFSLMTDLFSLVTKISRAHFHNIRRHCLPILRKMHATHAYRVNSRILTRTPMRAAVKL